MSQIKSINGKMYKLVYAKSVRVNGRTIYPKKSKVLAFWMPIDKAV